MHKSVLSRSCLTQFKIIFLNLVNFVIYLIQLSLEFLWFIKRCWILLRGLFGCMCIRSIFRNFKANFLFFLTRFLHELIESGVQINKELLLGAYNRSRTTKPNPSNSFLWFHTMLVHKISGNQSTSPSKSSSAMYCNCSFPKINFILQNFDKIDNMYIWWTTSILKLHWINSKTFVFKIDIVIKPLV